MCVCVCVCVRARARVRPSETLINLNFIQGPEEIYSKQKE
jgi:hypothetical protein